MTGRKPKPPELRLLEGNRSHSPIPASPKPRPDFPNAPRWLLPKARREWRRIAKELFALGLLTVIDKAALEMYCQCYARWKQADDKIGEMDCHATESGYMQQDPHIAIAVKFAKLAASLLTEFGMSPSSRARVNVEKLRDNKSEFERLLGVR